MPAAIIHREDRPRYDYKSENLFRFSSVIWFIQQIVVCQHDVIQPNPQLADVQLKQGLEILHIFIGTRIKPCLENISTYRLLIIHHPSLHAYIQYMHKYIFWSTDLFLLFMYMLIYLAIPLFLHS